MQIVNDPALLSKVHALIENQQLTALSALQVVMNGYAAQFARIEQELFPRADDRHPRRDPADRVASDAASRQHACRIAAGDSRNGDESVILVAHEILPSQAMSLGDLPIAGIVTELGGSTSHAAILARSRGIPAVSGVEGIMGEVESGDLMIVDGRDGMVLVRPDQEATSAYRKVQREFFNLKDRLVANRDLPAMSADGTQVELLANINNVADAQAAQKVGATGVGLFRTEYLFLTHHDVPGEEEQYEYYRQIILNSPNQTDHDPHARPGGRQDGPLPGPARASPIRSWAGGRPASSSRTPSSSSRRSARSSAPAGTARSRCSSP